MAILLSRSLLVARTAEVKLYVQFLRKILDKDAQLYIPQSKSYEVFHKDLTHTLKANGYLLLYNAVEAVCAAAFEDIHGAVETELRTPGSTFSVESLNINLVQQVLRRFKASTKLDYDKIRPEAGQWLVEHWLQDHKREVANNHNPLMSGNLDSKAMRELAEKYGFDRFGQLKMPANRGPQNTKVKRNSLAHGHESFTDCGRDLSLEDFAKDAIGVFAYLRRYVRAVENYINQRGYAALPLAAGQ